MISDSSWARSSNSIAANIARTLVCGLERMGLRGAPTLLRLLSRFAVVRRVPATVNLSGHLLSFPAFDEYWCRYLWTGIPYEEDIAHIFRKLGPGAVLLDGGANIGYWSLRAGEFGFTKVIAVEPNPEVLPYLRQNLRTSGVPAEIVEAAIHVTTGETLLLNMTNAHAESRLGPTGQPVRSVSIRDIAKDVPADQEIIAKLDVEGAELAAIDGAQGIANIVFIYEDFRMFGMSTTRKLLERGLVLIGVDEYGRQSRIKDLGEAFAFRGPSYVGGVNLIAVRPERAVEIEAKLTMN